MHFLSSISSSVICVRVRINLPSHFKTKEKKKSVYVLHVINNECVEIFSQEICYICYICVNLHRLCQFSSIMHRAIMQAPESSSQSTIPAKTSWSILLYFAKHTRHALEYIHPNFILSRPRVPRYTLVIDRSVRETLILMAL